MAEVDLRPLTKSDRWRKWICSGVSGLEIDIPLQVNYQYDKEAEDIVNFQVFHARDTREQHDLSEFLAADEIEYIRTGIFESLKDRGKI